MSCSPCFLKKKNRNASSGIAQDIMDFTLPHQSLSARNCLHACLKKYCKWMFNMRFPLLRGLYPLSTWYKHHPGQGNTESKSVFLILEFNSQWTSSWCLLTRDSPLPSQARFISIGEAQKNARQLLIFTMSENQRWSMEAWRTQARGPHLDYFWKSLDMCPTKLGVATPSQHCLCPSHCFKPKTDHHYQLFVVKFLSSKLKALLRSSLPPHGEKSWLTVHMRIETGLLFTKLCGQRSPV